VVIHSLELQLLSHVDFIGVPELLVMTPKRLPISTQVLININNHPLTIESRFQKIVSLSSG
jgi:hypothetical protein